MNDEKPKIENIPVMPNAAPPPSKMPQTVTKPSASKNIKVIIAIVTIVILIIGIGASLFWGLQTNSKLKVEKANTAKLNDEIKLTQAELEKRKVTTGEDKINKSGFQAVFLTSGQVYFGKITGISETQITLENIYYLRVNSNPNATDQSLVKLGCELHGPEDIMNIERKNVQFWENQKDDSQVTKAIVEYEKANPDGQKCAQ